MKAAYVVVLLASLFASVHAGRLGGVSLVTFQHESVRSETSCDTCLFSFRMLDDILADPTVIQDLVAFVQEHICPALGGGEKCTNLAQGLLPVIVDWVRSPETAKQFCKDTGSCPPSLATQLPRAGDGQVKDAQCTLCELMAAEAQQLLNNTQVLDKINSTAQKVCSQLPPDMALVCANMVNKYEPMLEALIATMPPSALCQLLGVCLDNMHQRLTMTLLQPSKAIHRDAQMTLVNTLHSAMLVAQRKRTGNLADACDMCKMAVIEAHSVIMNPQIQQSLTNYTENLCVSFGPSFSDTCKMYVDTYAPVVFNILGQYLVPDTVCQELGVCKPPLGNELYNVVNSALETMATSVRHAFHSNAASYDMTAQHMAAAAAQAWADNNNNANWRDRAQ